MSSEQHLNPDQTTAPKAAAERAWAAMSVRYAQAAHRLVESDRMVYRPVFDHSGNPLGTIMRLLIDRRSGHVDQVVVLTHGHFGFGQCEIELPWAPAGRNARRASCRHNRHPGPRWVRGRFNRLLSSDAGRRPEFASLTTFLPSAHCRSDMVEPPMKISMEINTTLEFEIAADKYPAGMSPDTALALDIGRQHRLWASLFGTTDTRGGCASVYAGVLETRVLTEPASLFSAQRTLPECARRKRSPRCSSDNMFRSRKQGTRLEVVIILDAGTGAQVLQARQSKKISCGFKAASGCHG
jgi:hypothetical protein